MKLYSLLSLLFVLGFFSAHANNLQVSNVSFEGTPGDDFYDIYFDISWENSWRTSTHESNYDAAWVFVKYRNPNDGNEWYPALVGQVSIPAGTVIEVPNDQLGFFIQRSADGIGDVSYSIAPLQWQLDYEFDPGDEIEICVYAIEMVYIPEGPFQVGDGLVSGDITTQGGSFKSGGFNFPFTITSEDQITLGGSSFSNLSSHIISGINSVSDDFYNSVKVLPASYPKGFSEFYTMKYELSAGQYTSFLNSLSAAIAGLRYSNGFASNIQLAGSPSYYVASYPERAIGGLSGVDLVAYADWSGLRPMSELEYEKMCRGPRTPVLGEFSWGDATIWTNEYYVSDYGTSDERISNARSDIGNANYSLGGIGRPTRCGIFALSGAGINRQSSGASYYGVLDLTGNVSEQAVRLGNPRGRSFNGNVHGDGIYDGTIPEFWTEPSLDNPLLIRGGAFGNSQTSLRVSYRITFGIPMNQALGVSDGGRLVRSSF